MGMRRFHIPVAASRKSAIVKSRVIRDKKTRLNVPYIPGSSYHNIMKPLTVTSPSHHHARGNREETRATYGRLRYGQRERRLLRNLDPRLLPTIFSQLFDELH